MNRMLKIMMTVTILAFALAAYTQEALELGQSYKLPDLNYNIDYPAAWFVHESMLGRPGDTQLVIAATEKDALDEPFIYLDPSPFNPLESIRIIFLTEPLSLIRERPALSSMQERDTFLEDPSLEHFFQLGISLLDVKLVGEPEEIEILGVPALRARVSDLEEKIFGIVIQGLIEVPEMDEPDRAFLLAVEAASLEELEAFMPIWEAMKASLKTVSSE